MRMSFVVLHYNEKALPDTFDCVNSILKNSDERFINIIIVENGSQDRSYEVLCREYDGKKNVKVIKNEKNEGFARGNNVGIRYDKDNFDSDFIFVLNNDTIIEQNNILKIIQDEFDKSHFDIMGPRILTRKGDDQNPLKPQIKNINDIEREIRFKMSLLKTLYKKISIKLILKKIKKLLKSFKIIQQTIKYLRNIQSDNKNIHNSRQLSIQLHGAALIFSRSYLNKYQDAFYPKTFLYHEENILDYIVRRDGLLTVYNPLICVFHKEDVSTDFSIDDKHKQKFILQHSIESLKCYRELMINDKHIIKNNRRNK